MAKALCLIKRQPFSRRVKFARSKENGLLVKWTLGLGVWGLTVPYFTIRLIEFNKPPSFFFYFGRAWSKGFVTLSNVSKLTFFDKIGPAKSVGFRFYSAIWRSESRISSRYPEITSISLIYSNLFEEERMIMLAFPGFEPTHLCDPSDQRRL